MSAIRRRKRANPAITCGLLGGAISISLFMAISCGQPGVDLGSNDRETNYILDQWLLKPQKSCEELKREFSLDGLPIVDTPDEASMPFEAHDVPLSGGGSLRAWVIPAPANRGTVLMAYGAVGSLPCYLFTTHILHDAGWSVVMYDYRGFGASSGQASLSNLAGDLDRMLDWTLAKTKRRRVTLMGVSLGTIPVIAVAARRADDVNAVVLDSPVNLGAELRRFGYLLRQPPERLIGSLDPDVRSDEIVDRLTMPSLFYLHERDGMTPPRHTLELFARAGGEKELAPLPGVGHARGVFLQTELYRGYLDAFLTEIWERREPKLTRSEHASANVPEQDSTR